jgi:hypothetical protein
MEAATRIRQAAAVMMVVVRLAPIGMVQHVLIVRRKGSCGGQSTRAWRRHHARKLGDQEQADQQTDKPWYRPQEFHNRLNRIRRTK